MTDEQIRLYAIARVTVPTHYLLRTIAEPVGEGGTLYTLEVTGPDSRRWFAIHSTTLRESRIPDWHIAEEIRRSLRQPSAPPQPA